MKCIKCGKEINREDGENTITGIRVDVTIDEAQKTPENIKYYNRQLGKYSDGNGECHVAICYECYVDGLLGITVDTLNYGYEMMNHKIGL